jgi:hypothetical protein
MLLSSIIAGTEINHGKGGFGNYSSVLVPLCSNVRSELKSPSTHRNVDGATFLQRGPPGASEAALLVASFISSAGGRER